jgi:regulator of protease activity HflC (stomatin/prohibitin superfamily)
MGSLVLAVVLVLAALVSLVVLRSATGLPAVARSVVPGGLMLLAVVVIAAACVTTVGTKDIGVVTVFGRPTGRDLPNGIHLKAPWQAVTEMDGAIQPDEFTGDQCIQVRIGDSSTACANMTIRWRIVPSEAASLYQNYRSNNVNETIKASLVVTQLKAAVNGVLGSFNPLANVNEAANAEHDNTRISAAPDLDAFSTQIVTSMNARLAAMNSGKPQIEILSVTLSFLQLADSTQAKINAFQAEVGNTRIAEQQEKTAAAQAAANGALSASVSHDPNVLVSRCLDTLAEMVKERLAVPAGFSCWPGAGSALVVPQAGR